MNLQCSGAVHRVVFDEAISARPYWREARSSIITLRTRNQNSSRTQDPVGALPREQTPSTHNSPPNPTYCLIAATSPTATNVPVMVSYIWHCPF